MRNTHLRVIEGRPWKQALVCALNPEAPYSPWVGIDDVARGDVAVVVLDTEPRTVLCAFTRTASGDLRRTIAQEALNGCGLLRPVSEVEAAAGVELDGDEISGAAAQALLGEVTRYDASAPVDRAGDSSVAVARILLGARGKCTACYGDVAAAAEDDVDRLVHTAYGADVITGGDWPALLCGDCAAAMRDGGFSSVVDFVFSRCPACPVCSARRTSEIGYGMPSYEWQINITPWERSGGCCISPERWSCGECGYTWGSA